MADIFNVEPPRWLQERTSHGFKLGQEAGSLAGALLGSGVKSATTGENFFTVFKDAVNTAKDPFYMEKAEAMRANAELTHATTADKLQGMKEYPEWMKETGGDWKKVLDTPFTGTSQYASELVSRAKQNAWMRSNTERAIEVKKLQADNAIDKVRQDEEYKASALEERKRHNLVVEGGTGMAAPETKEFDDGSKLIHVSPNRWQYVKGGATKGMSTSQLMAISKSLKDLDPKDTTARTIDEALKSEAVQQVKGGKGKPTETAAQVSTYNDEDEARTDGKKAGDIILLYGVGKVRLK